MTGIVPGIVTGIVAVPETGELVLTGGAHGVGDLFCGRRPVAAASVATFAGNIAARRSWCASRGIPYGHWVFPDVFLLKAPLVPGGEGARSIFEAHYGEAVRGLPVHYPLALLERHADNLLKTDTHYSPIAGLRLAAAIARTTLGLADPEGIERAMRGGRLQRGFCGDLGVQLTPPVTEDVFRPKADPVRMGTNGVTSGNDGILILLENENALSDATLMIFGDSFFRMLLAPLAHYARRVVFCRTRFFHPEIVPAFAPDAVLTGNAERYLSAVAGDEERPHALAMALGEGRAQVPDGDFAALWAAFVDRAALLDPSRGAPYGGGRALPAAARSF